MDGAAALDKPDEFDLLPLSVDDELFLALSVVTFFNLKEKIKYSHNYSYNINKINIEKDMII